MKAQTYLAVRARGLLAIFFHNHRKMWFFPNISGQEWVTSHSLLPSASLTENTAKAVWFCELSVDPTTIVQ